MVWICISLIANDIKHVILCLLLVDVSSFDIPASASRVAEIIGMQRHTGFFLEFLSLLLHLQTSKIG